VIVKNVTFGELEKALAKINEKMFEGNITWKRAPEPFGRNLRFTLTVNDSAAKGGRRGHSGKRVSAACWHAHGHFFDAVFHIAPDAIFQAMGNTITLQHGNWQDKNVGSIVQPKDFSDMCECSDWVWNVNFYDLTSLAFEDALPDPQELANRM